MNKITLNQDKSLKLSNVLIKEIEVTQKTNLPKEIISIENYIKAKGTVPVGPLIQKTEVRLRDSGEPDVKLFFMRQCRENIDNTESPYKTESILRVGNCIYCRFVGNETDIGFAYEKIKLFAYENDIILSNDAYTVFVDQVDDVITADVFMERAD